MHRYFVLADIILHRDPRGRFSLSSQIHSHRRNHRSQTYHRNHIRQSVLYPQVLFWARWNADEPRFRGAPIFRGAYLVSRVRCNVILNIPTLVHGGFGSIRLPFGQASMITNSFRHFSNPGKPTAISYWPQYRIDFGFRLGFAIRFAINIRFGFATVCTSFQQPRKTNENTTSNTMQQRLRLQITIRDTAEQNFGFAWWTIIGFNHVTQITVVLPNDKPRPFPGN